MSRCHLIFFIKTHNEIVILSFKKSNRQIVGVRLLTYFTVNMSIGIFFANRDYSAHRDSFTVVSPTQEITAKSDDLMFNVVSWFFFVF